jgi:hypothetical protein
VAITWLLPLFHLQIFLLEKRNKNKTMVQAGHRWLPEIRRITVQVQPGQNSSRDPISKKPITKKAGVVAQGIGPEFKSQYCRNKTKTCSSIIQPFLIV